MSKKSTLCEETGHSYLGTTANNYRVCQRSDCQHAQRLAGEQWVDVKPSTPQPTKRKANQQPPALSIWDACDNSTVHVASSASSPSRSVQDYWR